MEQPLYYWDPSIAPSSLFIYKGDRYPEWDGDWFITTLRAETLFRFSWKERNFVKEERLYANHFGRLRHLSLSTEGFIYILIDDDNGSLVKLEKKYPFEE